MRYRISLGLAPLFRCSVRLVKNFGSFKRPRVLSLVREDLLAPCQTLTVLGDQGL